MIYRPYSGSAGPEEMACVLNTEVLAEKVPGATLVEIEGEMGKEMWAAKDGRHVIYDRWGFCDLEGDLDNVNFEAAVEYLKGN